jgi:hypothetical protein
VTGLRIFAAVLLISLPGAGYQPLSPTVTLSAEEEKESYLIYSTLLEDKGPRVQEWAIVQQTRTVEICLHPTKEQESIYGSLFEDYALKNKKGLTLGPYFKLPAYTMVPPEAWTRGSRSIAAFSAVGFNKDRTRAAVCVWIGSGGTCHVLIKKDDIWQIDKNWRGDGCGWSA